MKKELLFAKNLIKDIVGFQIEFCRSNELYRRYSKMDDNKTFDDFQKKVLFKIAELDEDVLLKYVTEYDEKQVWKGFVEQFNKIIEKYSIRIFYKKDPNGSQDRIFLQKIGG